MQISTQIDSARKLRVESSINSFSLCNLNWRNHFGGEERKKFCPSPLNSAAEEVTGADSIWAVGICQLVTALHCHQSFSTNSF